LLITLNGKRLEDEENERVSAPACEKEKRESHRLKYQAGGGSGSNALKHSARRDTPPGQPLKQSSLPAGTGRRAGRFRKRRGKNPRTRYPREQVANQWSLWGETSRSEARRAYRSHEGAGCILTGKYKAASLVESHHRRPSAEPT